MKTLNTIVLILLVIGGLNWLLVGLADFDLVATIFGDGDPGDVGVIGTIVYVLVGISAIYALSWFSLVATDHRRATHEV